MLCAFSGQQLLQKPEAGTEARAPPEIDGVQRSLGNSSSSSGLPGADVKGHVLDPCQAAVGLGGHAPLQGQRISRRRVAQPGLFGRARRLLRLPLGFLALPFCQLWTWLCHSCRCLCATSGDSEITDPAATAAFSRLRCALVRELSDDTRQSADAEVLCGLLVCCKRCNCP